MYTWECGDRLQEIIKGLGFDCNVISDNSLNVPMSYRPSENTIRYNMGRVQGIGMKRGYMLHDTFFCLGYHELGHYIELRNDPSLANNLTERKMDYVFLYNREEQAYLLGRKLITNDHLLPIYDRLNKERLDKLKQKIL